MRDTSNLQCRLEDDPPTTSFKIIITPWNDVWSKVNDHPHFVQRSQDYMEICKAEQVAKVSLTGHVLVVGSFTTG